MMTDHFDQLLSVTEQSYRDILARSWAMLVERTAPDDAAAIEAASDLQRELIQTGAAWLALCERVRAMEQDRAAVHAAPVAAHAEPPRGAVDGTPVSTAAIALDDMREASRAAETSPVKTMASNGRSADRAALWRASREPTTRRRQSAATHGRGRLPRFRTNLRHDVPEISATGGPARALVATPVPATERYAEEPAQARDVDANVQIPIVPVPAPSLAEGVDGTSEAPLPAQAVGLPSSAQTKDVPPSSGEMELPPLDPASAGVPGAGPRVFPLVPDALPLRAQPTAMAFNGASWLPIAAWRRLFQQVLQTLQGSDPTRFAEMASELTLHNGRPLFNRDRTLNLGAIDVGGGWYTTGQMPTELILQRLRRVLEWWGLSPAALEVELAPYSTGGGTHVEPPNAASEPQPGIDEPVAQLAAVGDPDVLLPAATASTEPADLAVSEAVSEARSARRSRAYPAATLVGSEARAVVAEGPPPPADLTATAEPGEQIVEMLVPEVAAPAPVVVSEQPAEAGAPVNAATPAPDNGAERPRLLIPDEPAVVPARPATNVRWVRTASGTALPLRPPASED